MKYNAKLLLFILFILVIGVSIFVALICVNKWKPSEITGTNTANLIDITDTSLWPKYQDQELGIEFRHPPNVSITRLVSKDNGGRTVGLWLIMDTVDKVGSHSYLTIEAPNSNTNNSLAKPLDLKKSTEDLKTAIMKSSGTIAAVSVPKVIDLNGLKVLQYCVLTNILSVDIGYNYLVPLANQQYPNLIITEGGFTPFSGDSGDLDAAKAWFMDEMRKPQQSFDPTIEQLISTLKILQSS